MIYSLSTMVYYNYLLKDAILAMAKLGYTGVDIWGGRQQAYRDDLTDAETVQILHILDGEGMVVPSVIPAQFRYPTCLCSPVEKIRKMSVEYICLAIDLALKFRSPIVSICPGHTVWGQSVLDGRKYLAESVHQICEYAAQFPLKISLEPADKYETDIIPDIYSGKMFIEELDYPNLGIVLDTGHEHLAGNDLAVSIMALDSQLFNFHVDDNNGLRDQHLVPGDGTIDFDGFIDIVKKMDDDTALTAELSWDYSIDPQPYAARNLAWMKANFG